MAENPSYEELEQQLRDYKAKLEEEILDRGHAEEALRENSNGVRKA